MSNPSGRVNLGADPSREGGKDSHIIDPNDSSLRTANSVSFQGEETGELGILGHAGLLAATSDSVVFFNIPYPPHQ